MSIESLPTPELIDNDSLGLAQEAPPQPIADTLPPVKAAAVEAAERFTSVDVIRGFALLGILAMNIVNFGWPGPVYSVPIMDPEAGNLDTALWGLNHLIFDTKMMTLFSMLFGAGLVLMSDRADGRGAKLRGVYYRRVFWLLVIGLIHAYLIWDGDILVMYASCGFLLYPFRKLKPRTLIITGVVFNLVFVPLWLGFKYAGVPFMQRTSARAEAQVKEGKKPQVWEQKVSDAYKRMIKPEKPRREDFLKSIATHRGPYKDLVAERAGNLIAQQTLGFVFGAWWLVGGRMLIGMGLMKLGVFSAMRSRRSYLTMMLVGYGVGLPLMVFDIYHQIATDFFLGRTMQYILEGWPFVSLYGSVAVVFGHIGAVMLICQSGTMTWLTSRLAAAGRMALSNYLLDSIICTTFFYGYGFDVFAALHRPELYVMVLLLWALQLYISPIWLSAFRFGPAEWVWRSLTYWKLQPIWEKKGSGTNLAA